MIIQYTHNDETRVIHCDLIYDWIQNKLVCCLSSENQMKYNQLQENAMHTFVECIANFNVIVIPFKQVIIRKKYGYNFNNREYFNYM